MADFNDLHPVLSGSPDGTLSQPISPRQSPTPQADALHQPARRSPGDLAWAHARLRGSLLDPINENRLLTMLARRLWECNSPDRWLRLVMCAYPKLGCLAIPLTLLGQFMILPAAAKRLLNWRDWRADRVLAADRFAWSSGQGERLLHQIAQWIDAGLEEPDPYLPRYAERRGHLEGLVRSEQTQMVNQGLTPAYPLRESNTAVRAYASDGANETAASLIYQRVKQLERDTRTRGTIGL